MDISHMLPLWASYKFDFSARKKCKMCVFPCDDNETPNLSITSPFERFVKVLITSYNIVFLHRYYLHFKVRAYPHIKSVVKFIYQKCFAIEQKYFLLCHLYEDEELNFELVSCASCVWKTCVFIEKSQTCLRVSSNMEHHHQPCMAAICLQLSVFGVVIW